MASKKITYTFTFLATMLSLLLIIINGVWLALNGKPIVISSFYANSVDEITGSDVFWGRIAFGFSQAAETPALTGLAILILITSYSAFQIYKNPRRHNQYGLLIATASLLALPFGGGFYIGTILGFIAGVAGMEWPRPFKETFFGYFASVARLNRRFFTTVVESSNLMTRAALTVAMIGFVTGLGSGLYAYNVNLIDKGEMMRHILLEGGVVWHQEVILTSISSVMITVVKWLILSLCIFWIGARLTGLQSKYNTVAQTLAFCYVPVLLEAFMPMLFSTEPALSFTWPVGLYVVSRLWFLLILIVAVREIFDLTFGKSVGIALFAGMLYWIGLHTIIVPALDVGGVQIIPSLPESSAAILSVGGITVILAILLGVFSEQARA